MELPRSYSSAREAVSYRVIYGASRAINMKEIEPRKAGKSSPMNDEELSYLFKMIRLSSQEEIKQAADKYLQKLSLAAESLQQYHVFIMELVSELYKFAANNEIDAEDYLGDMRNLYSHLLDLEPDELGEWLLDISFTLRERLISARSSSTKSFVSKAVEYVSNNYSDEGLSLDTICKFLNVSNAYFSTVFKKETGNSFIGYLTEYRMKQASRQLIESNEKSYIIAKSVGYTDPNYFSYVFKRQFGVSPSKYRAEYVKSE